MKVVYSEDYKQVYSTDPASAAGRIEAIEFALGGKVTYLEPAPASEEDILKVHTPHHIRDVERDGLIVLFQSRPIFGECVVTVTQTQVCIAFFIHFQVALRNILQ
ncbi:MAG: hypothetical protein CVU52_06720 [Deltaproteobacteria bacterium HGW-Deltaproteobacteria-10]|nr:MAG: hypothetical protein CVU52_06720 [Deltaproteobacteria bacterium HGW-Deltaproteobacteria-10]